MLCADQFSQKLILAQVFNTAAGVTHLDCSFLERQASKQPKSKTVRAIPEFSL